MFELCFNNRVVKRIRYNFFFLLLKLLVVVLIFFFWIRFQLDLGLCISFSLRNEFLDMICKFEFDKQRALSSILTMSITDSKKVLMECLAHIWCEDEVVLIFLVRVMDTKSFSCRVSESCNYIVFNYFQSFILWVSYDSERRSRSVCNSIIVINSLIIERGWLWYLPSSYKTLYRSHQWVLILLTQLVLDQRRWLLALTIRACLL